MHVNVDLMDVFPLDKTSDLLVTVRLLLPVGVVTGLKWNVFKLPVSVFSSPRILAATQKNQLILIAQRIPVSHNLVVPQT